MNIYQVNTVNNKKRLMKFQGDRRWSLGRVHQACKHSSLQLQGG